MHAVDNTAPNPDLPGGPAGHWLGIVDKAHDLLAPRVDARKREHVEGVLHQLEADLAPLIGPVVAQVLENPGASDELKALLAEATEPGHQFGSLVIGFAIGATIGPVLGAALAPEIEAISKVAWANNPSRPVSADVAATGVLKGVFDEAHGAGLAALSGFNAQQFDHLVQASGQSIGIAEALLLYRRQQIDLAHLEEIIRYSNVNPRFYADVPKLQYGPPPAGEVVAGLLKGHLTAADAAVKLGHAGINPVELEWMRATAGRPPSPAEMVRLWHRGAATETDVEAAVRQSDINDDFMPFVKELGHWYPPPRSIMAMLRDGSITDAQGRQLFTFAGVPPFVQDYMLAEAHHSKGAQVKELTSAQVVRMYSARLYDRATANAKLLALRYTQDDATLLLDFADEERHERMLSATITKIGTLYVAHKIHRTDAAAALNTAGVPVAAQHDLFTLWDIQRGANVAVPSPSMVIQAYRRQDLTPLQCKNRLLAAGVQPEDLAIFIVDGWPPKEADIGRAAAAAVIAA